VLSLQAGGKSDFRTFRELELGEGTVDLVFVAPGALILEADTQRAAIAGKGLESKTPALGLARRSRNSRSVLIATPACFRESRNSSKDSVLRLPMFVSIFSTVVAHL
jgi:hypothetical protein